MTHLETFANVAIYIGLCAFMVAGFVFSAVWLCEKIPKWTRAVLAAATDGVDG